LDDSLLAVTWNTPNLLINQFANQNRRDENQVAE
jgi:hypothetical protein